MINEIRNDMDKCQESIDEHYRSIDFYTKIKKYTNIILTSITLILFIEANFNNDITYFVQLGILIAISSIVIHGVVENRIKFSFECIDRRLDNIKFNIKFKEQSENKI